MSRQERRCPDRRGGSGGHRRGDDVLAGPARRRGRGVRAVRAGARQRGIPRSLADHPPLVSHTGVRGAHGAGLRGMGGRRARERRAGRHHHRWPRPVPARRGHRCHDVPRQSRHGRGSVRVDLGRGGSLAMAGLPIRHPRGRRRHGHQLCRHRHRRGPARRVVVPSPRPVARRRAPPRDASARGPARRRRGRRGDRRRHDAGDDAVSGRGAVRRCVDQRACSPRSATTFHSS